MTIRKIIDDIRNHAGAFLAEVRLRPMVRLAGEGSLNDLVVFQSRGGREHVVLLAIPRNAGDDAWQRAMIAPRSVHEYDLPGTGWTMRDASGVSPDDVVLLNEFDTVEARVGAVIEHIAARGDEYAPRDDVGSCICTDARIATIVARLAA